MKLLLVLLAALVAASDGQSPHAKRQSSPELVRDGSFESVPQPDFSNNFTGGHWTFWDGVSIATGDPNGPYYDTTPYGSRFVAYYQTYYTQKQGYVSQPLRGLTVGAVYMLNYAYEEVLNLETQLCTFNTTFGNQMVDTISIAPGTPDSGPWTNRSTTFTPQTSNGILKLEYACFKNERRQGWEFHLDAVSLKKADTTGALTI